MDAAGPRATQPGGDTCPNCWERGPGRYCPTCGQRQRQRAVSLRQILLEVLDDQFSVNSALPRTLRALVLQPWCARPLPSRSWSTGSWR